VAKESPAIEFVPSVDFEDQPEDRKKALIELMDLGKIFTANLRHEGQTGSPSGVFVAVKKSKVNAFNERDGILFYALREAMVL
jgi:hypothetical protein